MVPSLAPSRGRPFSAGMLLRAQPSTLSRWITVGVNRSIVRRSAYRRLRASASRLQTVPVTALRQFRFRQRRIRPTLWERSRAAGAFGRSMNGDWQARNLSGGGSDTHSDANSSLPPTCSLGYDASMDNGWDTSAEAWIEEMGD